MPTIKKKVRKLEAQGGSESRYLWQNLTVALHNNDLESATASKHEVSINKDCLNKQSLYECTSGI